MNILASLNEVGLNADNSVVIGSGILNELGLRQSNDIDLVVTPDAYSKLEQDTRFTKKQIHGRQILTDELFEIGPNWVVLGKSQTFDDLLKQSTVIGGVRYVTVEFLLAAR